MGKRIVEQTIKRMRAPEENSRIEWDAEIPGFGVRITAAGVTSFISITASLAVRDAIQLAAILN